METFEDYLQTIDDINHREKMADLLAWVKENYPDLDQAIKWNQPMFTDHGTYIIGMSISKKHIAVSPEKAPMDKFRDKIEAAGYSTSSMIFRLPWDKEVDYSLLKEIIDYQIEDKKDYDKFWR